MKILYIAQYFDLPEEAGSGRHYAAATELCRKGHQVTVITGMENYRTGRISDQYKGKLVSQEEIAGGVKVLKTRVYTNYKSDTGKVQVKKRLLNHFSFMFMAIFAGLKEKDVDLVFASSTPLFVGISGWALGVLKNAPFVFEIRDPWPTAAIALGILKNPLVIKLSRALEAFIYRKAKVVVSVTDGFREGIIKQGVSPEKVEVVPHGVDLDIYDQLPQEPQLKQVLGLEGKFVCVYIGAHGIINDLHIILQAAGELKEHKNIFFLFMGDGTEKANLIKLKQDLGLQNVTFMDSVAKNRVPAYLSVADVCLFSLSKEEFFQGTVPNKIFDYLACAKPTIINGKGDSKQIIEAAEAGFVLDPEDSHGMAEAILKVYNLPVAEREKLGTNGRNYVMKHYRRKDLAAKLTGILEKAAE